MSKTSFSPPTGEIIRIVNNRIEKRATSFFTSEWVHVWTLSDGRKISSKEATAYPATEEYFEILYLFGRRWAIPHKPKKK